MTSFSSISPRINPRSALFLILAGAAAGCFSGAKNSELEDVAPKGASASPTSPSQGTPEAGVTPVTDGGGVPKDDGGSTTETTLCDDGLSLTSTNAFDAAKAIGLCKKTTAGGSGSGLVDARFIKPDGTPIMNPESWGLLTKFGSNVPTAGKAMLALSSGAARAPGDPGYQAPSGYDKGYTHAPPAGQPRQASVCTDTTMAPGMPHDGVALELKIRVPASAKSLSFSHQLFTSDYSQYVCSQYNDVFVVLMDPKPAGNTDNNIVFDAHGDSLGVNSASLLRACTPSTAGGLTFACPLGPSSLTGTGFEAKAATGWLTTTVPVQGGSDITLRFAVWDSGDGILDTTVLVDELAFSSIPAAATNTVPR